MSHRHLMPVLTSYWPDVNGSVDSDLGFLLIFTDFWGFYYAIYMYIYICSSQDDGIQLILSAQYRKCRSITARATLTYARCDIVFSIRRWRRWSIDRSDLSMDHVVVVSSPHQSPRCGVWRVEKVFKVWLLTGNPTAKRQLSFWLSKDHRRMRKTVSRRAEISVALIMYILLVLVCQRPVFTTWRRLDWLLPVSSILTAMCICHTDCYMYRPYWLPPVSSILTATCIVHTDCHLYSPYWLPPG